MDIKKLKSYMTVADYANKIGVTRQTVYNMMEDGRVGYIEIAGRRLVNPKS